MRLKNQMCLKGNGDNAHCMFLPTTRRSYERIRNFEGRASQQSF